ncbi:hypothetical protein GDO78_023094 [Eleutherodactylus coqui]|uniref:Taste receptor type 2 n=1 Tax=Eleutherodactylus coqui TaxID=57060 RepID=A0A8J6EFW1_ELECQ|nr:hypothetical protein GDO78_023094 [Eleutherodactylus coqui]
MDISIQYILTAVLHVMCLVGLTVNLIIVATHIMKWKSLKSLSTCDKILTSLAISRVLYLLCIIIRTSIFQFLPWLVQDIIVLPTLNILGMFVFYSSLWIATILCVFYCVKIATYNYKLFIFLKTRISTMVPWLIQASLVISLISSLLFGWYGYDLMPQNSSNKSTENVTSYGLLTVPISNNRFLIFAVGSFPPFLILCFANFLLIHFLLMHTRRMRSNGSNIQRPNLQSHFSALKSMTLFVLLQIMFLICMSFTRAMYTGRVSGKRCPTLVPVSLRSHAPASIAVSHTEQPAGGRGSTGDFSPLAPPTLSIEIHSGHSLLNGGCLNLTMSDE